MKELKHNDLMPFGKHKGNTIGWLLENEPKYLLWASDNISTFYLDHSVKAEARLLVKELKKTYKEWDNNNL